MPARAASFVAIDFRRTGPAQRHNPFPHEASSSSRAISEPPPTATACAPVLERGCSVSLVKPRRFSPKSSVLRRALAHRCDVRTTIAAPASTPIRGLRRRVLKGSSRASARPGPTTPHPYADGRRRRGKQRLLRRLSLPPDLQTEALLFRGSFAYPLPRTFLTGLRDRAWLALTRAAPWTTIHHVDPIIYEALLRRDPRFAPRLRLMPDPVEPAPEATHMQARRTLGIPDTGRYIGCVGYLDRRKGIDQLVRHGLHDDDRLLVGRQEPESGPDNSSARQASQSGRIVSINRFARLRP